MPWKKLFLFGEPFNNYVDKKRGKGGSKLSVFVRSQGVKTVQAGERGVKKWQTSVHVVVERPLMLKKSVLGVYKYNQIIIWDNLLFKLSDVETLLVFNNNMYIIR